MFKRHPDPTPRLICFGSARGCTNFGIQGTEDEDDLVQRYYP
jgi:hypothetical protein